MYCVMKRYIPGNRIKILWFALILILLFTFASCGQDPPANKGINTVTITQSTTIISVIPTMTTVTASEAQPPLTMTAPDAVPVTQLPASTTTTITTATTARVVKVYGSPG